MFEKQQNKFYKKDNYIVGVTNTDYYEFYIDVDVLEEVKKYCWHRHRDGYLRTYIGTFDGHHKYILLHKFIMELHGISVESGKEIDHINRNPWDNRFENLRIVSHMQNMKNRVVQNNNKSGVVGVFYSKIERKWKAYIDSDKKHMNLGTFENKEDAIEARRVAEKDLWGEFSREK